MGEWTFQSTFGKLGRWLGNKAAGCRRMFGPEAVDNMETQLIALEGILNEEQMSTYRTQVQTRMETYQSGGGRPRGPGGR